MKPPHRLFSMCILTAFMIAFPGPAHTSVASSRLDHHLFTALLGKHVKDGAVSYAGFKNEEDRLDQYLDALANTHVDRLSKSEQFAFYINAYNAWTIKLILTKYPGIESIWDLGNFIRTPWKKKICRINGKAVSLDHIEHKILRPRFKDPRVHFAINCASKGCPPLRSEAYTGKSLDRQLEDATRRFVNDPARNRLDGKTLYVSKIFKWFKEDFNGDVPGFFMAYAEGSLKRELKKKGPHVKIRYLDYDWTLNGS